MKKSIIVLVAAFFIGTLSAFTLKDVKSDSISDNTREEGTCKPIVSGCTGANSVCSGIQTLADCNVQAKQP